MNELFYKIKNIIDPRPWAHFPLKLYLQIMMWFPSNQPHIMYSKWLYNIFFLSSIFYFFFIYFYYYIHAFSYSYQLLYIIKVYSKFELPYFKSLSSIYTPLCILYSIKKKLLRYIRGKKNIYLERTRSCVVDVTDPIAFIYT